MPQSGPCFNLAATPAPHPHRTPDARLSPASPLVTPVRLLREIAGGPRSTVYLADRERAGERTLVAVKVYRHRFLRDADTLFRLRDVGRELCTLAVPAIVAPSEVVAVGGRLGLLSPYVDGVDLFDLCEVLWDTDTGVPTRVVCAILHNVARALHAAAHTTGANGPLNRAHRDLRPTNVMITRTGEVRVLDLGTGFTSAAGREARTQALKKGLSRYLSPSRRDGKRGGPQSDVYALGIIGLELTRGRWLRRLRSRNPDHDRHLAEVVARVSDLGFRTEGDDLALRNLLLRMVAHDAHARPVAREVAQTCDQLAGAATGPTLVAFAKDKVVPWLEAIPTTPDLDLNEHLARPLSQAADADGEPQDTSWSAAHALPSDTPEQAAPTAITAGTTPSKGAEVASYFKKSSGKAAPAPLRGQAGSLRGPPPRDAGAAPDAQRDGVSSASYFTAEGPSATRGAIDELTNAPMAQPLPDVAETTDWVAPVTPPQRLPASIMPTPQSSARQWLLPAALAALAVTVIAAAGLGAVWWVLS